MFPIWSKRSTLAHAIPPIVAIDWPAMANSHSFKPGDICPLIQTTANSFLAHFFSYKFQSNFCSSRHPELRYPRFRRWSILQPHLYSPPPTISVVLGMIRQLRLMTTIRMTTIPIPVLVPACYTHPPWAV